MLFKEQASLFLQNSPLAIPQLKLLCTLCHVIQLKLSILMDFIVVVNWRIFHFYELLDLCIILQFVDDDGCMCVLLMYLKIH